MPCALINALYTSFLVSSINPHLHLNQQQTPHNSFQHLFFLLFCFFHLLWCCVVSIFSLAYLSWFHYYGSHHPCAPVFCVEKPSISVALSLLQCPCLWWIYDLDTQTYTNIKASIPKVDAHSPSFWLFPLFNTSPPSATPIPQLCLERTSVVLPFGLWSCRLMGCRTASTLLTLCVLSAAEREWPEQNARLLLAASATPCGASSAPPYARL